MGYDFFIYIIYIEIIVGMARNRSMQRTRNRSRNRSKRGGMLSILQSSDMKKFKELLRENTGIIQGNFMDKGSVNLQQLFKYKRKDDAKEFLKKVLNDDLTHFNDLKNFWNGLYQPKQEALKQELGGADKKVLYLTVVEVLESDKSAQPDAPPPSAVGTDDDTAPLLIPGGGKSRRRRRHSRRHSRRTNKIRKSRKGRKMRRN